MRLTSILTSLLLVPATGGWAAPAVDLAPTEAAEASSLQSSSLVSPPHTALATQPHAVEPAGETELERLSGPRLELLHCDEEGAVFLIEFPEPRLTGELIDGREYTRVWMPGIGGEETPGLPDLPVYQARLWVPPGARLQVSYTVGDVETRPLVAPLPVPSHVERRLNDVVTLQPIYELSPVGPSLGGAGEIARHVGTDVYRGWSLARFEIRPASWSEGTLTTRRRVRVEVSFVGGSVTSRHGVESGDHPDQLDLMSSLAPNAAEAQLYLWRLPRPSIPEPVFNSSDLPRPALKVVVDEAGLYQITPEDLRQAGLDPDVVDPRRLGLYGSSGRMLRWEELYDELTLEPHPVLVTGAEDGSFDDGDALYFWGEGGLRWADDLNSFEPPDGPAPMPSRRNHYTDYGYYWLVLEEHPARFAERDAAPGDEELLTHLQGRVHFERDNRSYHRTQNNPPPDTDFYWDNVIPENRSWTFNVNLTGYYSEGGLSYLAHRTRSTLSGSSGEISLYSDSTNDPTHLIDTQFLDDPREVFERWCAVPASQLRAGSNTFSYYVTILGGSRLDAAMDAVDILYPRDLRAQNGLLSGWGGFGQNGPHRLTVEGLTSDEIVVWDTTRGESLVNFDLGGSTDYRDVTFTWNVTPGAHLVAADLERARQPVDIYLDTPSNLHEPLAADVIYIAHPDFIDSLDPLLELHSSRGYRVKSVRVDDIYDEFSGGGMDPRAIRSFIARAYAQAVGDPPSYVVLVGDGSYDYRDSEGIQTGAIWRDFGENFLPPLYFYYNSTYYPADNYYGVVDPESSTPQLAVTRISVIDTTQLEAIVERSRSYLEIPAGDWQLRNVYVVDNQEYIAGEKSDIPFDIYAEELDTIYDSGSAYKDKIYLTSLGLARTGLNINNTTNYSNTHRLQGAREHITPRITDDATGALLYNFIGHGGWHTWTHELSLTQRLPLLPDIQRWGIDQPPLLLQSSCSLSDFDRSRNTWEEPDCISELLHRHPAGVLGSLGASRLTTGGTAQSYHRTFLDRIYHPTEHLENPSLGMLHLGTLLTTGSALHRMYWVVFGDGPLPLRRPTGGLSLDTPEVHSVRRGDLLTVTGTVTDPSLGGDTVTLTAYDRPELPYTYSKARVYRRVSQVTVPVIGGVFEAVLPIPSTIDNDLNPEQIPDPPPYTLEVHASMTGADGLTTAVDHPWNFSEPTTQLFELPITGTTEPPPDNQGPLVELIFDDGATGSGDLVSGEVKLRAELQDPHGILIARSDAGFGGISGQIDRPIVLIAQAERHSLQLDMTDDFTPHTGDYTRGSVTRALSLPPGNYTLTLICYDRFGEPGIGSAQLRVSEHLELADVLVVPNPVTGPTAFTFTTNRRPDAARIRVYTPAGRLVRTIEPRGLHEGFNVVEWNGDDDGGRPLANGVYLYSVELRSGDETTISYEKLIMLR